MTFGEYKIAAIRHLNTCKQLLSALPSLINTPTERQILQNIYYLSGYTIECIVNYAIYDYLRYNPAAHVNLLTPRNNASNVSFYGSGALRNILRIRGNPRYIIQNHKFQINCQFFATNGITDCNKVPHFDGFIPNPTLIPLFDKWKPECRYIELGFSKNEIIGFCILSEEILNKTRLYITKN